MTGRTAATTAPYQTRLGMQKLLLDLAAEYRPTLFFTEHHFWYDGYCPALLVACAALAARTERIKIGTGVLLLPMHDPLRVAEAAIVVDRLSGGRLVLGVGLGYRDIEFDAFGVERRHRARRLEDGVRVIRAECARSSDTGTRSVSPTSSAARRCRPWILLRSSNSWRSSLERSCRISACSGIPAPRRATPPPIGP